MPRRWTEVDWREPPPSPQELVASWQTLAWEPAPLAEPALDRYLEQVRATHVDGGCLVGRWRAACSDDATSWFVARNRFEEYGLLRLLFDSDVVRADLAELQIPATLDPLPGGLAEQWAGPLCLDGLLAGVLVSGGAYRRYDRPAAEAKALAAEAADALIRRRYEDFRLDATYAAWTGWFGAVLSYTYVLTDRADAEITVLCITDRD